MKCRYGDYNIGKHQISVTEWREDVIPSISGGGGEAGGGGEVLCLLSGSQRPLDPLQWTLLCLSHADQQSSQYWCILSGSSGDGPLLQGHHHKHANLPTQARGFPASLWERQHQEGGGRQRGGCCLGPQLQRTKDQN